MKTTLQKITEWDGLRHIIDDMDLDNRKETNQ